MDFGDATAPETERPKVTAMEHVGSSDCWVSSIQSAHKIWARDLGNPTPGLLGSSCSCKICSVLFQQLTVALKIFLCQGMQCLGKQVRLLSRRCPRRCPWQKVQPQHQRH